MIKMTVEISEAATSQKNEFGVGVMVYTNLRQHPLTDHEGATFAGLCLAINEYMRSRGALDFDCLKQVRHQ